MDTSPRYRCTDEYRHNCGACLFDHQTIRRGGHQYCEFCGSSVKPDEGIPPLELIRTEVRLPQEVRA